MDYLLGFCNIKGVGTPQNFALALQLWEKVATQNDQIAYILGVCCERGLGDSVDMEQAKVLIIL